MPCGRRAGRGDRGSVLSENGSLVRESVLPCSASGLPTNDTHTAVSAPCVA
jgi:hypothetical protein